MSDNTERLVPENTPPDTCGQGRPEAKPETPQTNPGAGPSKECPGPRDHPREALKRGLEQYRLPADVKKLMHAELPPLEEQERLYRELQEKGGLSSEEFFASLGQEVMPQP